MSTICSICHQITDEWPEYCAFFFLWLSICETSAAIHERQQLQSLTMEIFTHSNRISVDSGTAHMARRVGLVRGQRSQGDRQGWCRHPSLVVPFAHGICQTVQKDEKFFVFHSSSPYFLLNFSCRTQRENMDETWWVMVLPHSFFIHYFYEQRYSTMYN